MGTRAVTAMVGMTTADRPVPTIHESLISLRGDAGYFGPVTILDDGSRQKKNVTNVLWVENDKPKGPLINWMALFMHLYNSGADYLIMLEDDILWADGAWSVMWHDLQQLRGEYLYSPYSSYTVAGPLQLRHGKLRPGIYQMNFHKKAGGSQCYVFTRKAALALMADIDFQARLEAAEKMPFDPRKRKDNMNCDRDGQISAALMRQRVRVLYRVPSLVNHSLGSRNSSYWSKAEQDTNCFDRSAARLTNHVINQ